ncbi:MAG: glucosylceramidase [Anaerolineae bacterium]|nr:glucosylceramidase [Anaerolineae bacterium]
MKPKRTISILTLLLLFANLLGSLTSCTGPTPAPTSPPSPPPTVEILPTRAAQRARTATDLGIPEAAWSRPIGLPVESPPTIKTNYPITDDGPMQGAPLGGIGAGTFSRTYAGDFARWHLKPTANEYQTYAANMFSVYASQGDKSVAQALWTGEPEKNLDAWQWNYPVGAGNYYALYPRSWFVYDWEELPVELSVEQFSPIIPGDYQAGSYPVALFVWTASNPTDEPVTTGVMFTNRNMLNWVKGQVHTVRAEETDLGKIVGIEMGTNQKNSEGTAAVAALETPGVTVSYRSRFVVNGDGADIWEDFAADGALDNVDDPSPGAGSERLGGGVAVTFDLQPGESLSVPFVMAWDSPIMEFGEGDQWYRRYTAFYGRDGDNAWQIAVDGLANADEWHEAITDWQEPILADESRPLWYKTALFNDLYFIADGGTAWEHGMVDEPDPGPDYLGSFAYLECYDYFFYNTFDVDFYASFALMQLWPEIEVGIMRGFAATVDQENPEEFIIGSTNERATRKLSGAVPHDLGSPDEAPWLLPNAYTWQNVNVWKDLNAKFVLRLYRDAVLLDRPELVDELWPAAVTAMNYLATMDEDGDGIPENDGIPDQTYDTWPATGVSAYSGGLWISALYAMSQMAGMLGDEAAAANYAAQLDQAIATYEDKLWNGEYYNYDETTDAIMADQLAGEWYARISGHAILPDAQVDSALNAVYDHNVLMFQNGQMGAVNGIMPDGTATKTEQGDEVWTGTTYMLAAHMLLRGLDDQAWGTAYGVYRHTYEDGLWFRTPEGWDARGNFRAGMYMRPLSVWAIEAALDRR